MRVYKRSGTLWEGRYRSCLAQDNLYLLACQRYIELNLVRATMVDTPDQYCWSSYRANALSEDNPLITPHALYQALGTDPVTRQQAYRELFRHQREFAPGPDRFSDQNADTLGRRVVPGKPGRPRGRPSNRGQTASTLDKRLTPD